MNDREVETLSPIYKGKKIDSDEYAEGIFDGAYKILIHTVGFQFVENIQCDTFFGEVIDPLTLKISFDGGETWNTSSVIKSVLKDCEELVRITTRLEELNEG